MCLTYGGILNDNYKYTARSASETVVKISHYLVSVISHLLNF